MTTGVTRSLVGGKLMLLLLMQASRRSSRSKFAREARSVTLEMARESARSPGAIRTDPASRIHDPPTAKNRCRDIMRGQREDGAVRVAAGVDLGGTAVNYTFVDGA